jgi:hypothetical protein
MFTERDGGDNDEEIDDLFGGDQGGGDQGGGDQGCDNQGGDDEMGQESDDELLPDLDLDPRKEPTNKKARQERKEWKWEDGDLEPKDMPTNVIKPKGMEDCKYAVEYFMKMFGKDTFNLLLEETNIHRLDVNKKIGYIRMEELRKTIGILMYMSVVSLPNIRLYWKKAMGITAVSKVMSRDRFEEIVSALHLSNNHLKPDR